MSPLQSLTMIYFLYILHALLRCIVYTFLISLSFILHLFWYDIHFWGFFCTSCAYVYCSEICLSLNALPCFVFSDMIYMYNVHTSVFFCIICAKATKYINSILFSTSSSFFIVIVYHIQFWDLSSFCRPIYFLIL